MSTASTAVFLHPNLLDGASLSGGSWISAQPLSNLQDPLYAVKARSSSLSTIDTKIDIDLDKERKIRGVMVAAHNLTTGAYWQVEGFSDSGRTNRVYNSTLKRAWASSIDAERDWEEDEWYKARPTDADVAGFNWHAVEPVSNGDGQAARYWTITFDDSANPDGYVAIGRVMIAGGWKPSINFQFGLQSGYEDDSTVEQSFSGVEFFRRRQAFRVLRGDINFLEEKEAFGRALGIQRLGGTTKEVGIIPQPDDADHLNRRSFIGRFRSLNVLEQAVFGRGDTAFEIKEKR